MKTDFSSQHNVNVNFDANENYVEPVFNGAQLLLKALVKEGVEIVFGIPGGANLPIYQHLSEFDIRHVLVRHEQGGAHMADGYARASGKVGVCFATSGPGALNLITGLATAHFDSVPIVAITGQVAASSIGSDAFQESDVIGTSLSVTKHSYQILDASDIPYIVEEAFRVARSGRPGAVVIDIPKDVQQQMVTNITEKPKPRRVVVTKDGLDENQLALVVEQMKLAKNPVILAGRGVAISKAQDELVQLAEIWNAPVGTTLLGVGVFPGEHRLAMGLVGFMGTGYCNLAVTNCDVLLMIGMRADDRVTCKLSEFAPMAKCIIHINIDPAELGKTVNSHFQIAHDAKEVLQHMVKTLPGSDRIEWLEQINAWKVKHQLRYPQNHLLQPQDVLSACYARVKKDDIIVADVGLNQIWAAIAWSGKQPGHFLNSGGQGTMGFALPAAIGAQSANPDKLVLSVMGEGGFMMTMQEVATAVEAKLPVKIIILNNGHLGMVRQFQDDYYGGVRSQINHLVVPDFELLAKAFGCFGKMVNSFDDIETALDEALSYQGPAIIDFQIDPEANVYPIVPLGKGLADFVEWK